MRPSRAEPLNVGLDSLEGELHVLRCDGHAIVPTCILMQPDDNGPAVGSDCNTLGKQSIKPGKLFARANQ